MRAQFGVTLVLALSTCCSFFGSAQAGDPKTEADRCLRWLDAFFHGQIDQTVAIASEKLRPGEVPDVYVTAQREKIEKLYDLMYEFGSGPPRAAEFLVDTNVNSTGDIVKRQIWRFGSNLQAYAGCVIYPGVDNPWNITVKFEDDLSKLTTKLESAAKSRVAAPPE